MYLDFNNGWKYRNGAQWVDVTLPHDAMIDSARSAEAAGGGACAYFDGGIYEYAKEFDCPAEWADKSVSLIFEGIYRNAAVYLNGEKKGEWAYGYTGFFVKLDGIVPGKNEIRVVADNSKLPNSRWYTGGGIYRPVSLVVKDRYSFVPDSISVKTVDPHTVEITSEYEGEAVFTVYDGEKKVASANGNGRLEIPDAKLWNEDDPHLYTLKADILSGGQITDRETLSFGMRTIRFSPEGLFVNGNSVLLRGACVHHDNGLLGARSYAEAEARKAFLLKKAGYNAVRCAHNPCSAAFLDACDRLGLYVIDEAFDMWYMHKKKYDYASDFEAWHDRDLEAMVKKDRNHPSVIAYSIGNEVSEPAFEKGLAVEKEMIDLLHSLDDRPVTAGVNLFIVNGAANGKGIYDESKVMEEEKKQPEKPVSSTMFNMIAANTGTAMNRMANSSKVDRVVSPCLDLLDIAGYNYASGRYAKEGKLHPDRLIFGSETFPQDIYRNWEAVKKYPYLCGDFMWTGFDYLGETGIGGWCYETQRGFSFEKPYPWMIADCGAIDIIGTITPQAKYAAVVWGLEKKPVIAVKPCNHPSEKVVKAVWRGTNAIESWSWKSCEGNLAEIEVYSEGDRVLLLLNGRKIGAGKLKARKAVFRTRYVPGTLEAVSYDKAGRELARASLTSAAAPELTVSCESFEQGKVCYFPVTLADNGTVEANDDRTLKLTVEGGTLLAFGSAEQKTTEPYSSDTAKLYYGRAMAVILVQAPEVSVTVTDGKESVTRRFR